jgi:hypothetical protein
MIKKQLVFISNVAWLQKLVAAMCWKYRKKDDDPRTDVVFAKAALVKMLKQLVRYHQEHLKTQEVLDDNEQVNVTVTDIEVTEPDNI